MGPNSLLLGIFGFVTVVLVLSFMIPMVQELLPIISADSGPTTGLMVQSIILIIIVCGIFVMVRQVMSPDEHANLQG